MNTSELINDILANKLADLHFCMPAKILSYDFKTQKATVKPSLNLKYNDGQVVELPIIHNVPCIHPASGGASITFPVLKNDNILLVFSEVSLEDWLEKGEQITPDDPRRNDLTDAIALLGFRSFNQTSPAENNEELLISYSGSKIRLKPSGIIEAESNQIDLIADEVNVTAPNVTVNATTVDLIAATVNVSGNLTAQNLEVKAEMKSATAVIGGKNFAIHTHNDVKSGGDISGVVT